MNALKIIACAAVGAVVGGFAGFGISFYNSTGDYDFSPLFYGPMGAAVGGFVGVVAGALAFA